jgi:hypothetical protein
MKVFVRTSSLGGGKAPEVIAYYPDDSEVAADAHGSEMTMLVVPKHVLKTAADKSDDMMSPLSSMPTMPKLADDWRETAASVILQAEAKRRTEDVFPVSEQMSSLRDLLRFTLQYGTDTSKWPTEAKNRKAEIDSLWNYVGEVRERVRALSSLPNDPVSDKNWPTRMTRKK